LLPSSSNISTLHDPFLGLYILFKGLINKLPSSKTSIQEGLFNKSSSLAFNTSGVILLPFLRYLKTIYGYSFDLKEGLTPLLLLHNTEHLN
jgi:hypothetical protein